jgi:hypothetical protein
MADASTRPTAVRAVRFADTGSQNLFEKLVAETGPLQGERELTVNAVEAEARSVVWDYDWPLMARHGLAKRCLTDDGAGMGAEDLERYIGGLGASGKSISRTGNLGVGAKVALAARNPLGVEYRSWTAPGDGAGALFGLADRWGLRLRRDKDGDVAATWRVPDDTMPELIAAAGHGTQITLWGRSRAEDTFLPPESLRENRARWLVRCLNSRFLDLPGATRIRVRAGAAPRPDGTPNGELVDVVGHRPLLERRSEDWGTVRLERRSGRPSDARVHWWILDDDARGRRAEADEWVSSGHVGTVWQGELYTLEAPTRGGYTALQGFGVRHGYERVVLIVEPIGRVESTIARSRLLLDERELPMLRWQEEFARQMPSQIRELMRSIARASTRVDLRARVAERARQAPPGFWQLPRYRRPRRPDGPPSHERAAAQIVVTGTGVFEIDPEEAAQRLARNERLSGKRGARKVLPIDHEQVLAGMPVFEWLSLRDATRSIGELEDLALRYDEHHHRLQLNRDFRGFAALFDPFLEGYRHVPGAPELIEQAVREEITFVAFETLQWALALSHSSARTEPARQLMLSPESLTIGLTPRLLIVSKLDKVFRQRHGRPADRLAAAG